MASLSAFLGHKSAELRSLNDLRCFEVDERKRGRAPGLPGLEALLPDAGYPIGVVELSGLRARAGGSTLAAAAIAALHREQAHAYAAWIDPESSLHAPGLQARGVELERLVVVRPSWERMTETAIKVATSGAFDVVVVDVDPPGTVEAPLRGRRPLGNRGELFVRKLQLAAEAANTTIFLLTDAKAARSPLPVSLRLQLERRPQAIALRVDKERHGRMGQRGVVSTVHGEVG